MRVETDVITTIAIGIAGAVVGGFLLRFLLSVMGLLAGLVGAVLGCAILLIWLYGKDISGARRAGLVDRQSPAGENRAGAQDKSCEHATAECHERRIA